jgi:hypothetical protein
MSGWAGGVDLVNDGKPVAEIVLSEAATPSVKTAAIELQRNLEAMSGVKLSIVSQASTNVANQVYVGESDATRKMGFSLDDVKYDGFKIVAGSNSVILAGRQMYHSINSFSKFKDLDKTQRKSSWEAFIGHQWRLPPIFDSRAGNDECGFHSCDGTGTLYAMYELLGQLGVRWYMPVAEIGIVIPKLNTITVKEQSLKREPQFPVRIMGDGPIGQFKDEFLWLKSMGLGTAFVMPIYHSVSGPTKVNPPSQPQEYYGRINGKTVYSVPKLSNERLRADTVEYLEWVDKAFPGITYSCIGQPDGWSLMDDDDVAAGWDKIAGRGPSGRFSDYAWDFNLDIRKRIMAKHPDKKFTVFAYAATRRPPASLDKVPANMAVTFCQTTANRILPNNELDDRNEWLAKMSDKDQLLIWEYYVFHAPNYNFPPIPVIFTKLMQQNFSGLYDHSAGFLAESGWSTGADTIRNQRSTPRPGISHLMLYLHNRLCWDSHLDLQAVLDEYYTLFFGPARAEMKEFYEFAEAVWTRPEPRQITAAGGFLKPADVVRYFDILSRAKVKAGDTVYGRRIDYIAAEMAPLKLLFEKLKRTGPNLKIPATKEVPVIDGDLDKPFWRAQAYTFFPLCDMITGEISGHAGANVSFRWLNDNSALIIGVECLEPKMNKLQEGCKEPDSPGIYGDDLIEIRLETAQGVRPYIVINPAGTILDECVTDKPEDLPGFYQVSQAAVKKYADRWTVEVRIDAKPISGERPVPFFPWGVNVCRQRKAGNTTELTMLSPSGTNFRDMKCMANIFVRK